MLSFFRKIAIVSDVFQSDGEFIPDPRRRDRKSTFTQINFCFFGTISSCEIDDLSCLGIFDRCRRLAK